jgi:CHAT domain-containing protein
MLPDCDGIEIFQSIKKTKKIAETIVIFLTARSLETDRLVGLELGATDYIVKPFFVRELVARIRVHLRILRNLYDPTRDGCTLTLTLARGESVGIRIEGQVRYVSTGQQPRFDFAPEYTKLFEDASQRKDWRFVSKHCGKQLYREVFLSNPKLIQAYSFCQARSLRSGALRLRLETTRGLLTTPFECLFDSIDDEVGDYLVLRHPVFRTITGMQTTRESIGPRFLNSLLREHAPLKMLIISANTIPPIPGVEEEVSEALRAVATFRAQGLDVQVDQIVGVKATYDNVRDALKDCSYHIVHYAGHGFYDVASPENSALILWQSEADSSAICDMSGVELNSLLRCSDVRFFYLSCCYGARQGTSSALIEDDFLGIADSIIAAGVPAVLAFRQAVNDERAVLFARSFYYSLVSQGWLDQAVYSARLDVAADRKDPSWLVPILIQQS